MHIIPPLALALLMTVTGAFGVAAQTATEPAKKDAPAEAAKPTAPDQAAKPAVRPPPQPVVLAKGRDRTRSRVIRIDNPRFVHNGRQGRRSRIKRRRHSGWRRVWVYRAHDRHGDRHYKLVWRKFGGYFGPRGRIGASPGPRWGSLCKCRGGRAYRHY